MSIFAGLNAIWDSDWTPQMFGVHIPHQLWLKMGKRSNKWAKLACKISGVGTKKHSVLLGENVPVYLHKLLLLFQLSRALQVYCVVQVHTCELAQSSSLNL